MKPQYGTLSNGGKKKGALLKNEVRTDDNLAEFIKSGDSIYTLNCDFFGPWDSLPPPFSGNPRAAADKQLV
jgi:hypothetical protein